MSPARHPAVVALLSAVVLLASAWPGRARSATEAGAETAPAVSPIVTVNPVVLTGAAGGKRLLLRVTAPRDGRRLPIVLFSHGAQYSKDDYQPLVEFWASHGYVVIQPTHIESLALGLPRNDPRIQDGWRTRVLDMHHVLDSLAEIERQAPMLKGRLDRQRVLAAGHSFGGHTTAALIGGSMPDEKADLADARVLAGLMLAPPGAAPGFRNVTWKADSRPALSIVGMEDIIPDFNDEWRAHADYYDRSGGRQCMAALSGVKHYLGGILGTHRTEEKTPNPAALAEVERLSLAFLDAHAKRGTAWEPLRKELLAARPPTLGAFECK